MIHRPAIPYSYNLMAKPAGSRCNLHCDYCYYKDKQDVRTNGYGLMNEQVLESYVQQYIQSQACQTVVFSWQGGEPLLAGQDFFRKAVMLQKKYAGKKRIENTIQTNATLLSDNWCKFFRAWDFLVGVSIDGPREIHDYYRNDSCGAGSWEDTMKGISLLRDYGISFNTLTTINSHTVQYPLEVYSFLKGIGSNFQQFSPVVERFQELDPSGAFALAAPGSSGELDLTPWSVSPGSYGDFLVTLFDEWVRNDVGEVFIQQFEASLASWMGEDPGICIYRSTCGKAMMLEQNGDVFACDHYAYSSFQRGNLLQKPLAEWVSSEEQLEFGLSKFTQLPADCRACCFLFACYGECPRNRFIPSPEENKGVNYLCDGLKQYFQHVAPFMDYMAEQIRLGKSPVSVKAFTVPGN